ncbi:unnamed protein product [Adineta ricciae]|uniref:Dynein light chain 1, cytoplasmic n=1 Tax=Adineta ricciae TaxID=249248 RepID=A0A814UK92_ADIRI|nr:unnamed protein product [Adineta ricciae]CAF1175804.1 unnamed protein product [Adineta ricciae]
MYTSTYSSSPVRTSTSETRPATHQTQSYLREYYHSATNNDSKTMNDNNMSFRRGASGAYGNSASSLTSLPINTPISPRRYVDNYNNHTTNDTNRYQSTNYSSNYRSYGNENDSFHPNTARYDLSGNVRAYSYDNLFNEPNRSQTSMNNSRYNLNNNVSYNRQPRREHYTDYEDDEDDLIVKSTDLPASYEQEMISLVRGAFRKYQITNQRELAGFLKRAADKTFSPCWHCIVGRQFSSYVTHEMNGFIYFTKGPLSILLFKSGA